MTKVVYINSDLGIHCPDHFSKVYTNLDFNIIGWSSTKSTASLHHLPEHTQFVFIRRDQNLFRFYRIWLPLKAIVGSASNCKIIIIHDDPVIFILTYIFVKITFKRCKIIFRICHLFGENLLELNDGNYLRKIIIKTWIRLRNLSIRLSDKTIVMSASMGRFLKRKYNISDDLVPIESSTKITNYHTNDSRNKKVSCPLKLIYIGNIDLSRDFQVVFEGLSHLKKSGSNFELDVFTTSFRSQERDKLCKLIKKYDLKDSIFIKPPVSHSKIMRLLSEYDVGLSVYSTRGSFKYNSPLKTLEYIAARLPWLGTDIDEHRRLNSISKTGFIYKNSADICNFLSDLEKKCESLRYQEIFPIIDIERSEKILTDILEELK